MIYSRFIRIIIWCDIQFNTTGTVAYCPIGTTSPGGTYPNFFCKFAGQVSNTSSAAVASVGYEDYSSVIFNAISGASYPLNVIGTSLGGSRFGIVVYIDWNEDGSFGDSGEQYFNVSAKFVGGTGAAIALNGTTAIPDGVTPANKRMRIKYNFSSSTTALHVALATACSDMGNGQTEDYTIAVTSPTAATASVVKNHGAVYPNLFHDVLKYLM